MKLHNAMWPGLVGKEDGTDHPPISLEHMLDLTVAAEVNGRKYDGVDLFMFHPHTDPDASEDELRKMADLIASKGLAVGSLVAPVWPGTVGGSAFGSEEDRKNFVLAVEKTCRIAGILNDHGVRQSGVIRVDTAGGTNDWSEDPAGNTKKIAETFREAGKIAEQHGERIAAEGEICWGGLHSWKAAVDTFEATNLPGVVGFQAVAHRTQHGVAELLRGAVHRDAEHHRQHHQRHRIRGARGQRNEHQRPQLQDTQEEEAASGHRHEECRGGHRAGDGRQPLHRRHQRRAVFSRAQAASRASLAG